MSQDQLLAKYQAAKPEGRSPFCPRKGVYKFVCFYQGHWENKPVLMTNVNWKPTLQDKYVDTVIFFLQTGSLKPTLNEHNIFLDYHKLVGREIIVNEAIFHKSLNLFAVTWNLIPEEISICDQLNKALEENGYQIDLDKLDDWYIEEDDFSNEFEVGY